MKCNWDITLVHYMATGSALHRIEARAKIIELMVFIITIFMDREINALAMMLLFSFWVMRQSKLPLRYVLRVIHGGQHAGAKHLGWKGCLSLAATGGMITLVELFGFSGGSF